MIPVEPFLQQESALTRVSPPREKRGLVRLLFADAASALLTVAIAMLALLALPRVLSWGVFRAVWADDGAACRTGGACWAFLSEKMPFILFGIYPPEERWRPIAVILIVLALTLWSMPLRNWTRTTLAAWGVGTVAALVLMGGGVLGLASVPTSDWGGLPITLLLTLLSLAIGFPFAVLLALGRQSRMPVVRWGAIVFIEVVRGLPLLSMLFIASILLPIMLPESVSLDTLLRALAALVFYSAAYLSEVLRGGLQGVARGQEEAARALGLGRWRALRLIVLPQAIRNVIPPLTNTAVVIVKNTSLVLVVGLFDLLSAGRAALADPDWPSPYVETYLFVAFVYFIICFGLSRYTLWLERRFAQGDLR